MCLEGIKPGDKMRLVEKYTILNVEMGGKAHAHELNEGLIQRSPAI